jgi:integrase
MATRLTARTVGRLSAPSKGNRIEYDDLVTGFGVRVTAAGAKSFIFNYRIDGRERRITIGSFPVWKVDQARKHAKQLRAGVDTGVDPLVEKTAARLAPTVADMCERYIEDNLPKLRSTTAREYRSIIETYILPAMRHMKVADVQFATVDGFHRGWTKQAPYRANRAIQILSRMFSLAQRWGWVRQNPAKGIEKNVENKRNRYLSSEELARLTTALAEHEDQQAANVIRLLLLTGARKGEVLGMRWDDLDLRAKLWIKPGSATKQKSEHRVPLSEAAVTLLSELQTQTPEASPWVFPSDGSTGHRIEIKHNWKTLCKAAMIKEARVHDLRHTYASVLVSAGLSLPIIGALLGHSQTQTTQRYSHLFDDPLRAATERAAAVITNKRRAEVVTFEPNRKRTIGR